MNANTSCPCCSTSMLRHLSSRRSFWFCNHCRLEMPETEKRQRQISQKKATIPFNSSAIKAAISGSNSVETVAAI